jgi:hypothetical protein
VRRREATTPRLDRLTLRDSLVAKAGARKTLSGASASDDVQASRACEAALSLRLAEASVRSLSGDTLGNRRGCCTNPRRAHWSFSKGGVEKVASRRSPVARSARPRRRQRRQRPSQRAQPRFSQTALCNSHRSERSSCAINSRVLLLGQSSSAPRGAHLSLTLRAFLSTLDTSNQVDVAAALSRTGALPRGGLPGPINDCATHRRERSRV